MLAQAPFEVTTNPESPNRYLILSAGAEGYYLRKGVTTNGNIQTITSNLPHASMTWYFLESGESDYYYFVNHGTGKYLYFAGGQNIYLKEFESANADSYRFKVEASNGGYSIIAKGAESASNKYLNKQGGNNDTKPVWLYNKGGEDVSSRWSFEAYNGTFTQTHTFTVTTPSDTSFYRIECRKTIALNDVNVTYSWAPPCTGVKDYVYEVDNRLLGPDMSWYFEVAETSEWYTSYYIRNAMSHEYVYFRGSRNANNAFNMKSSLGADGTDPERYKFLFVKTPTSGYYYIVPRIMAEETDGDNMVCAERNGNAFDPLKMNNGGRNSDSYFFQFVEQNLLPPVITIIDRHATITPPRPGLKVRYLTNGNNPGANAGTVSPTAGAPVTFDISDNMVAVRACSYDASANKASEVNQLNFYWPKLDCFDVTHFGDATTIPYYLNINSNKNYSITAPGSSETKAKVTAVTTDLNRIWCLYFAGYDNVSHSRYFHIVNVESNDYLYHIADAVNTAEAFEMRAHGAGGTDADKMEFAILRRNTTPFSFNLVPRNLRLIDDGNNNRRNLSTRNNNFSEGLKLGTSRPGDAGSIWALDLAPETPQLSEADCQNMFALNCSTVGSVIYYTTDGSSPLTSNTRTLFSSAFALSIGTTLKAVAYDADEHFSSLVLTHTMTTAEMRTTIPTITVSGTTATITGPSGSNVYFSIDGTDPTTSLTPHPSPYQYSFSQGEEFSLRAIAQESGKLPSCVAEQQVSSAYTVGSVSDLAELANHPTARFVITADIDATGFTTPIASFSGGLSSSAKPDGTYYKISNLSVPLFDELNGAVIRNLMLSGVNINTEGKAGAVTRVAKGYTRIYNVGILPVSSDFPDGTHPSVSTTGDCVGGLVGSLRDDSRVVNCFSYADVRGADTVAGLVGNNTFASTAAVSNGKYTKLRTIVVNCMFYGDITGGAKLYPVYGGQLIDNSTDTGINNYNYYRNGATFNGSNDPTAYNCSFPAELIYLQRMEFHRSLLNANRELCGWWVASNVAPATLTTAQVQAVSKDASLMAKWVLDPAVAPYPILKSPGKYPSVINPDSGSSWVDRSTANAYEGKRLGTLTVTVKAGTNNSSAADQTLDLPITDMDTLHYDYSYRKVQLPYYNSVFGNPDAADAVTRYGHNYGAQVVTGWKVINVTGGTEGTFLPDWQYGYNFADRECTQKDLYDVSGRVFAQGGYYYVPNGVTAITIEAYWGKAIYVSDAGNSYDRVNITKGNTGKHFAPAGTRSPTYNGYNVNTTTIKDALENIDQKKTVYDYALVLVGNVQESMGDVNLTSSQNKRGYTLMSVDLDFDEEPDYCLEWQLGNSTTRYNMNPVRFDFLPIVELGIAAKRHNSTYFLSLGCYRSLGHFEVTETSLIRFGQFEFGNSSRDNNTPVIFNNGRIEQYCKGTVNNDANYVEYVILGGHLIMPSFTPGAHVKNTAAYTTRHCAVNALGGDFTNFYLTGGYNEAVKPYQDNPHCYIDGGRFGQVAAAYKEGIWGDVTWCINHAIINEFYGGGMMAQATGENYKIVKGSIDVVIDSCIVRKYCGGPKFGNMVSGKTVTTHATGTHFGSFYGAGNGGTNYIQYNNDDNTEAPRTQAQWLQWVNAKYTPKKYIDKDKGYHAKFDYEQINVSTGTIAGQVVDRVYYYSAQFATTSTGNVESTLKGCIIDNNFYGAGFLGGVSGTVTSILEDTRVYGSVFGAGYSASVPKVSIDAKDKTPPSANLYTGMITPQSGGTKEIYYWSDHHGSTASPATAASAATHDTAYFYTEVSLKNLGAVNDNVTLTIKGNSTVGTEISPGVLKENTGNVFGGGDESTVTGNTTVILEEGTTVLGNVYGGGNEGTVGGNSSVTIQDP